MKEVVGANTRCSQVFLKMTHAAMFNADKKLVVILFV